MKENQNEEEVLLMADKDDDSKLKAVDKSAAKEGIWRLLLPSMETTVFPSPFRIRRTCLPTCWDIPKTTGSHRPVQDQSEWLSDTGAGAEISHRNGITVVYRFLPRTIRSRGTSPQPLGFENRMDWEQLARLGFTSDCLVEYSIITVATASPVSPLAQQSICYSLYQLQDQLDCGHTVLRVRDESE